ncbi:MAG: hypothetical protein V4514_05410 [Pseudomonadota bacterium]|nr:hypothetical protein [Phenylobacterium sp.]
MAELKDHPIAERIRPKAAGPPPLSIEALKALPLERGAKPWSSAP